MPMPARSRGRRDAAASASTATPIWVDQISRASCSTQPAFGKIWRNSRWAVPRMRPSLSNRIARELVVPWSSARMQLIGRSALLQPGFEGRRLLVLHRDAGLDALERLLERPPSRRQLVRREERLHVVARRGIAEGRHARGEVGVPAGDRDLRLELAPVLLHE